LLVRSGPNVISAHECDTNVPADFDLVWSLQFHQTGIGFAALRVVNRPVIPANVTFLRKDAFIDSFYALSSGRAVPDYSDESLTGCWFQSRQYSRFVVTRG
jgi:hypothetical protein